MDNKFKALVNFQAASLEQVKLIAIIQCPIAIILANSMLSRVAKIFLVYSLKKQINVRGLIQNNPVILWATQENLIFEQNLQFN